MWCARVHAVGGTGALASTVVLRVANARGAGDDKVVTAPVSGLHRAGSTVARKCRRMFMAGSPRVHLRTTCCFVESDGDAAALIACVQQGAAYAACP
eukprot:IDg12332t1